MKHVGLILGCSVTAFLASGAALAEDELHDGFFLRLGLNLGPMMVTQSVDGLGGTSAEVETGGFSYGYDLLIGGSPVEGLSIGGALVGVNTPDPTRKYGGVERTLDGTMLFVGLGAFVNWYFDPEAGGHIQFLGGFGALDYVSDAGQSGGNDPTGMFLGFGGGYDFWVSSNWSIGPFGRILYAPLSAESGSITVETSTLFPSIGVSFTYN